MKLTKRETEVAKHMAWGCSVDEAADRLGISRWTVKVMLRHIYEKLGIGKVSELTAWVMCKFYGADVNEDFIGNVKRAVGAYILLLIFGVQLMNCDNQTFRGRRARRGRRNETEWVMEF